MLAIVGIYVGNHVEASGSHIYLLKSNLVLLPTYYCQVTVVLDCTNLYYFSPVGDMLPEDDIMCNLPHINI